MPRLKLKAAGNIDGSELRRTGDPQKSTFHHAVHPGKCRAHDGRIAMEGFEGGGDLQTGVAPQGRIDLLEDEGGGIDWKPGGRSGQGAANFRRWEITALRAEGKHACAGGFQKISIFLKTRAAESTGNPAAAAAKARRISAGGRSRLSVLRASMRAPAALRRSRSS